MTWALNAFRQRKTNYGQELYKKTQVEETAILVLSEVNSHSQLCAFASSPAPLIQRDQSHGKPPLLNILFLDSNRSNEG